MQSQTNLSEKSLLINIMKSGEKFSKKGSFGELKVILSRLWDICRLAFELYYIKFKIQEISASVQSKATDEKRSFQQFAKRIFTKQTSLEEQYLTK